MKSGSSACFSWVLVACVSLGLTGCGESSYPAEKIKEALLEICRTEYGVEDLDVKIVGKTIGVYLPLKKLFAADFKDAVSGGKIKNIETLFEPSPEALDKVEDVLFSISRVILSTDRPIDFYVLKATDVESTGLQLILKGYINDIKRVRVWDISRDEYRKRVIHELKLNQTVIWHKPVRSFFADLPRLGPEKLKGKYFTQDLDQQTINQLFFGMYPQLDPSDFGEWPIEEMRSTELNQRSAVVYAKVKPQIPRPETAQKAADASLEYLFIIQIIDGEGQISRVIPFQFQSAVGFEKIDFPKELQVGENLSKWQEEFKVEPIHLGVFLAQQITRRVQAMVATDERVRHTLGDAKLEFDYTEEDGKPHFVLNADVSLSEYQHTNVEAMMLHEDMRYVLEMASREFVEVLRSYSFRDYDYLRLNFSQDPAKPWIFGRDDLELFRRNKTDMKTLLSEKSAPGISPLF